MRKAERIKKVPPYLFAQIDKKKAEYVARGEDVIDFGIGDPDFPTPENLTKKLEESLSEPKFQRYPPYDGTLEFKQSVARWYKKRFNVTLEPASEVMALIGSKEGIAHMIWAMIDAGDVALIPDPAYPVYKVNTIMAGGTPYLLPMLPENNFLPDLDNIPQEILKRAKILFLNYPNNPTAAIAPVEYLKKAVGFCRKNDILLVSDLAYSEIAFDGYKPVSILEIESAKEVAIEFHSLSKTYNVTGWRIGMAVGSKEAIDALSIIKTNVDSGAYKAIQHAAAFALDSGEEHLQKLLKIYTERRDILVDGLNKLGLNVQKPKATFYVWVKVPQGETSATFCEKLLEKAKVLVVPGGGYGPAGEGFVRFAITLSKERILQALERMKGL